MAVFGILFACFSSAVHYEFINTDWNWNSFHYGQLQSTQTFDNSRWYLACFQIEADQSNCYNGICWILHMWNDTAVVKWWEYMTCTRYAWEITLTSDYTYHYYNIILWIDWLYPNYTSLECQTEYNLIPIDDVNANYCNLNFWMIDPRDCPTTEWTWAISWTPRFINDEQYPWTNLLNINIPEDIAHSVIYNEEETIVNVEWYNADENYINWILQKEKLTPTNEDIEEMITWFMINYFPYLALAIVFLYLARKIFKLFK